MHLDRQWSKTLGLVIKKSLSDIHFNIRWAESLSVFAQQKNLILIRTAAK